MHVVVLEAIFMVYALLGIMDMILAVLGELLQFKAPLSMNYTKDLKKTFYCGINGHKAHDCF